MRTTEDRILMLLQWYGPLTDEDLVRLWAIARRGLGDDVGEDWGGLTPARLRTGRAALVRTGRAKASAEPGRTNTGRKCQQWEAIG